MNTPLIYVWFHRPAGSAGMAPVIHRNNGPSTNFAGPPFMEGDSPSMNDPWSTRTPEFVEAALSELGWRVITRAEAATLWTTSGRFLPDRRFEGAGYVLTRQDADDTRWSTTCEFTSCAFAVPREDVEFATLVTYSDSRRQALVRRPRA